LASSSWARALTALSLGREIQIAGSSDRAMRANTCSVSSAAEIAPRRKASRKKAISREPPVTVIGMLVKSAVIGAVSTRARL